VRSVKDEALSRLILFGERALWHALTEYSTRYHQGRPHQGKGNVVLMPIATLRSNMTVPVAVMNGLAGC
jgi:hypothetical protein